MKAKGSLRWGSGPSWLDPIGQTSSHDCLGTSR